MTEVVITEDGIGHAKECQCGFHCYLEQLVTFYLIVNEHHFHQWSFFHIAAGNKSNICEYALNIINGNVPMNVNKLMPFEQQLKILCQPKTTDRRWRQGLSSIKGYKLFKLIRRPCICYLSAEWTLKNLYKYSKKITSRIIQKRPKFWATQQNTAKSQQPMLLQRVPENQDPEKEKTSEEVKAQETRENIQKRVLRSITRLNLRQTEKSKSVFKKLQSSSDVSINDEGLIEIDNIPAAIDASNFLFTLQQST